MAVKTDDKPTDEEKKEGDKVRVHIKISVPVYRYFCQMDSNLRSK